MGRTKGSKNKPKDGSVSKGRPRNKFTPLVDTASLKLENQESLKLKEAVQPKPAVATVDPRIDFLLESVKRVMEGIVATLQLHKAGFMDSWRQYQEQLVSRDVEPDAKVFLAMFAKTAAVLQVTIDQLEAEYIFEKQEPLPPLPKAAEVMKPVAPKPATPPVQESTHSDLDIL